MVGVSTVQLGNHATDVAFVRGGPGVLNLLGGNHGGAGGNQFLHIKAEVLQKNSSACFGWLLAGIFLNRNSSNRVASEADKPVFQSCSIHQSE